MNQPTAEPDPDPLEELLAEAIDRLQAGGSGALLGFLEMHPDEQAELAGELDRLRALGLLEVPQPEVQPACVGDFRLVRRIGSGGMGVVHEAEQVSLGRRVAVKLVRPDLVYFDHSRERFRREVEAASRLSHPGIAQVFAVGEERGLPWFAMELVEGAGLDALIRALEGRDPRRLAGAGLLSELERLLGPRQGSSSSGGAPALQGSWVEAVLRLGRQVAEALDHAHGRGVVHRDVKPSNVLLTRSGRAILVDFGLASTEEADALTRSGVQPGSLPYMSPEQLAGHRVGPASDIYSLAVLLQELLTLHPTFAGDASSVRSDIQNGRRSLLPRWIPTDLRTVLAVATDVDPVRRYATAGDLARDLGHLLERRPIEVRPPSLGLRALRWSQRHPRLAASLATAVLAGLAASLFLLASQHGHARELRGERDLARLELTRSQLERGALLARSGALAAAEAVLWPELFTSPESDEALWALRELYQRHPCIAAARIGEATEGDFIARPLALHPDGRRLLSVAHDGGLRSHELDTLETCLIGRQGFGEQEFALAPERGLLFHLGSALEVYSLDSYEQLARFEGPEFRGLALAIEPVEGLVLLGGLDGHVRAFDPSALPAATIRWDREFGSTPVQDLLVTPDGHLVLLGTDGRLLMARPPYERPTAVVEVVPGFATVASLSADGGRVVAGGRNVVRIFDLETGELLDELEAANGNLRTIRITNDGQDLLAGGWWALDRWSLDDRVRTRVLGLQTNALLELTDRGVWAATHRNSLRLWLDRAILGPRDLDRVAGPAIVRFAKGAPLLFVTDQTGLVRARRLPDAAQFEEWRAHTQRIAHLVAHGPSGIVWTSSVDGRARLWRGSFDQPVLELEGLQRASSALDLSADGALVALAMGSGRIELRDAADGTLVGELEGSAQEVLSLRFSGDGRSIAFSSRDGQVRTYGVDRSARPAPHPGWPPLAVDLDARGRVLAYSSWLGHVVVHDLESGQERELVGHNGSVWDLRFRPGHANQLMTCSGDGTARLWDVTTGRTLLYFDEFDGHETSSVDFDPSGRWLVIGSSDGRVRLMDLDESLRCVAGNLEYQLERCGGGQDPESLRRKLAASLAAHE